MNSLSFCWLEDLGEVCTENSKKMKEHLIDDMDYTLIPDEGWNKLLSWYGMVKDQEPQARKVIEEGVYSKSLIVEVYPWTMKICENSKPDEQICKQFSRSDTIEQLEMVMRQEFAIPDNKEVKLWNRYMTNMYEPLNKKENTLQDAGLYNGQVIVIEQKNEDGTWPGQAQQKSIYTNAAHGTPSACCRISRQEIRTKKEHKQSTSLTEVCEPCQYRKVHSIAIKYCTTCEEAFCQVCADVHGAAKASRSHVLVNVQDKVKKTTLGHELEYILCKTHTDKSLDFYCCDHSVFLCSTCLFTTLKHKQCANVFEISSAGKALITSNFIAKLHEDLQQITDQVNMRNLKTKTALMNSKKQVDSINTQIDKYLDTLDNIVTSLREQATKVKDAMAAEIDKQESDFKNSEREVGALSTLIQNCQSLLSTYLKSGSPSEVFRCSVSAVGQYNAFKAKAEKIKTTVRAVNVVADTEEIIQKFKDCKQVLKYRVETVDEDTESSITRDLHSEFQRSLRSCLLGKSSTSGDEQQSFTQMVNVYDLSVDNSDAQGAGIKDSDEC